MTASSRFTFFIACSSLLVLSVAGCTPARVEKPVTTELGGSDPDQQVAFFHKLAETPVTTYDDAFHALLLFTDGDDPSPGYNVRVQTLKQKGMLLKGFNRQANEAVDRGTVALALAKALKVRGGIVYSILPDNGRYATREMEFQGVLPSSSPNQTFSGSEFLAVMARAEDYQKANAGATVGGAGYRPPEMELKQPGKPTGRPVLPGTPAAPAAPAAPSTQPATQPTTQPTEGK
ncbi:MAG TPA: hypothetical protein VF796_12370 [Humisphaera sp.]